MDGLNFSIPEILSLFGVAQCIYIMVYMAFRSGRLSRGGLPLLYFFVLALAFFSDVASRHVGEMIPYYTDIQWALWFYGPPLSVLLIIQIAQISRTPSLKHYWILLLIPLSYYISTQIVGQDDSFQELLVVTGLISGGISILAIWFSRNLFQKITVQKTGKQRYWLILSLVIAQIVFLALMLGSVTMDISAENTILTRTIVGLAIVYLANTSLFRIYPQAVEIVERRSNARLSVEEFQIAQKVEQLLSLDKVYQEPTYSRSDLAKECHTSESVISRIINLHFRKSFPQIMNEHRIEDAKRLLKQTDAPIKTISEEVGFNALPSFNRVFKDTVGQSPSQFRKT